jgi:hypothetical protein
LYDEVVTQVQFRHPPEEWSTVAPMRALFIPLITLGALALPTQQSWAQNVLSAQSLPLESAEIADYTSNLSTVASTISSAASGGFGVRVQTLNPDGTFTDRFTVTYDDAFGTVADISGVSSVALDPLGRGFGVLTLIPVNNHSTRGKIAFFDYRTTSVATARKLKILDVGFHPDAVKFSPDGKRIIVANEGELKAMAFTGTAAISTTAVTVASTTGLVSGMQVKGTGIDVGTTISTIDSATQFTLSLPTTAAITNGSLIAQLPAAQDAPGSISVIDLTGVTSQASISAATFTAARVTEFDFQPANLGPAVTPTVISSLRYNELGLAAGDLHRHIEPENIAPLNDRCFVTLQENNAVAEFTYPVAAVGTTPAQPGKWVAVRSLGTITQTIDASDQDGASNAKAIQIDETVAGLPMPDGIAAFQVGTARYYITANEGDARVDDADLNRVASTGTLGSTKKGLVMDSTVLASGINANNRLARLNISLVDGDTDTDGDIDVPTMFGTRSVTIWDAATGAIVWDSGALETAIQNLYTTALERQSYHNINNGSIADWDTRSDDKGPEPESVTVGNYGGALLAFVGLERQNSVLIYNISDPVAPALIGFLNNLDRGAISPESFTFIPAATSPTKMPLLLGGYEGNGTSGNALVSMGLFQRSDLVIYKLATARNWNRDEVFNPLSSTPIVRNPVAGTVKDTAYLIIDRSTQTVKTIKYFTRIEDGAPVKEYTTDTTTYADWNATLPAAGQLEYLETLATAAGSFNISYKNGQSISSLFTDDLDGDGQMDDAQFAEMSYLMGAAKRTTFGLGAAAVSADKVAATLTGQALSNLSGFFADADGAGVALPARQSYLRTSGAQTGTLDTVLTTKVLTVLPSSTSGLKLGELPYATQVVITELDKLGYDAADPLAVP